MIAPHFGTETARTIANEQATALRRHAAEFEGILLSEILQKLKDSCQIPGDEESDSTSENLQSFATAALGKGLAATGGLGIADLLTRSLANRMESAEPVKEPTVAADKPHKVGMKD